MSLTHGMNIETIRQLAKSFDDQATNVQQLETRINGLVGQAQRDWAGKDSKQFVGEWNNTHRKAILKIKASLDQLADILKRNATSQEQVSGTLGGDSVGASASLGDRGSGNFAAAVNPILGLSFPGHLSGFDLEWALGKLPVPVVGMATDVVSTAALWDDPDRSFEDKVFGTAGTVIDNSAGKLRTPGSPTYLAGVAISQVFDVVDLGRQADFSSSGISLVVNFARENPKEALDAALGGVSGYAPKLISNFWPDVR